MKKVLHRGVRVMPSSRTSGKSRPILAGILAAVLVLGVLPGGLLARYVSRHQRENEMIAAGFHISSDALRETPLRYTAVCGPDGTFAVDLYNYELENTDSVSQVDISYRVTVTGGGTVQSVTSGGSPVTATEGVYILPKGATKATHTIAVLPNAGVSTLTVTVTTTAPYTKTISATFDISGGGITVTKSAVAGGITRLTIETNQYEGQITLTWPAGAYPNAGVVENSCGWQVGYNARQATLMAQKETTYYFEFGNSTISNTTVSYTGPGYAGATIQVS